MNSHAKAGFRYDFQLERNGVVIDQWSETNLMPINGIDYILAASLLGAAQVSQWHLVPYEGAYTPLPTDTAANLPADATECTTYNGATRPLLVFAANGAGIVDNSASRAELTFSATKTVQGVFISSNPAKGAVTGVVPSAVRFASPKPVTAGDILRVRTGLQITSA